MDAYKISMTLDKKELIDFIDAGFASKATITPMKDNSIENLLVGQAPPLQQHQRVARKPRGSKVNEAIIDKLRGGSSSLKELRGALETAGLAPNSVSTGLALLQKSGQVKRIGDGVYELQQTAAE